MGYKNPTLRPRCIVPGGARTQIPFMYHSFIHSSHNNSTAYGIPIIVIFLTLLPSSQPNITVVALRRKKFGRLLSRPSCVQSLNPWPEYKTVHNEECHRFPRALCFASLMDLCCLKVCNAHLLGIYYGDISAGFYYPFSGYIIVMQRRKEDLCGVRDVQVLVGTVLSVLC
jgi:hypothetical protein